MPYISKKAEADFQAWCQDSAKLIARRNITTPVQAVLGRDDAEIIALEKFWSLSKTTTDRAFLFSAAERSVIDAIRRVASRSGHGLTDSATNASGQSADFVAPGNVEDETVQGVLIGEAFRFVSDRDAFVVRAYYLLGKSDREIAEELGGLSHVRVVQVRLRALQKMRDGLKVPPTNFDNYK